MGVFLGRKRDDTQNIFTPNNISFYTARITCVNHITALDKYI